MKNIILTGDALDKLKEIPDEYVDCVITSPPLFMKSKDLLVKAFSFIKNIFSHRSFLMLTATQSCFFTFFTFTKLKTKFSLWLLNVKERQERIKNNICDSVCGLVAIHCFVSVETSLSLINLGILIKRTTKFFFEQLKDYWIVHFNLNTLMVGRTFNIASVFESPSGFSNSYITLPINNARKISIQKFFSHTSLIPQVSGEVKKGGGE